MEDIAEADETMGTASSKDSLRTALGGEFGTHSSKASVTSSIRALASSLGIKRVGSKSNHHLQDTHVDAEGSKMPSFSPGKLFTGSSRARDSLAEHATPYADLPPADSLPQTDHFKFATPDASILQDIDGDDGDDVDPPRSPKPVPRTGMIFGSAVKSTIRLVLQTAPKTSGNDAFMSPPRLPVVQTDFDLTAGTPGTVRALSTWPASPCAAAESLYPKLPLEDRSDTDDDDDAEASAGRRHRSSRGWGAARGIDVGLRVAGGRAGVRSGQANTSLQSTKTDLRTNLEGIVRGPSAHEELPLWRLAPDFEVRRFAPLVSLCLLSVSTAAYDEHAADEAWRRTQDEGVVSKGGQREEGDAS
ncbi:hypothetical protein K466DRAFT_605486 [Polyporus arcularius HHB13444]|uniref:Uncharacterized protein n=1 Tax=Polyporus arcularius HHB13444 TaxID=1314778 RepID=A0A5C3NS68_9APHY|nr:hypothetical protein K466DRAFT_605486 [Polyporus arcularius HHB13444]